MMRRHVEGRRPRAGVALVELEEGLREPLLVRGHGARAVLEHESDQRVEGHAALARDARVRVRGPGVDLREWTRFPDARRER